MKKSLFALVALTLFSVKADYLYWMITDDLGTHDNFVGQAIDFSTWDTAKLYVNGSYFDGSLPVGTLSSDNAANLRDFGAYAYADIGSSSSASTFLIELWSGESYLGYASDTYANLAQYIYKEGTMAPVVGGWMPPNSAYAVPEPTSGLLFLIGGMLLGLKRRRQQV